ncbi:aminotransferase class I/II-fold pyridoxal phosphate-dependent enzyme [Hydromonas duriensis]|uniref:8-amino-7-oxononanoate synthase n=1 Tax=Hydromonas duriensis TaxID=1527608 RepID=A0A4R6Y985_9BURK|nr:8-amino-7-oxononanoate synthase [Hydromonas duriensis]TDR32009.1 8-amino-7-oxononanoate synthase [Hydromonas duriensis]
MSSTSHFHTLHTQWAKRLEQRDATQQRRRLRAPLAIDFCSNDYLGWARREDSLLAISRTAPNLKNLELNQQGATGSRLLSGQRQAISDLETRIAQFHQTPAALLFNSGFDANIGTLAAISNRHTVFIYDELAHASLIDGMRLSMSRHRYKFRHNDVSHLAQLLRQHQDKPLCVVVESIYSMDGDAAPLLTIAALTKQFNACLVVDEAHATGIFGVNQNSGEGLVQRLGLERAVDVRIHTFGKGLGCHGAAVVGSQLLIDTLINFARPLIYSTALPPTSYAAIARAYDALAHPNFSNAELHALIASFRARIEAMNWSEHGVRWLDSSSPIQGLIIGDVARTLDMVDTLRAQQLDVRPIFSPTVPAGSERLRICLHAFNTTNELDILVQTLWRAVQ